MFAILLKISVIIDINQDALNWWQACNSLSYGVDWKTRTSSRLQKKITGKSKKAAFKFLLPYIKTLYKKYHIERHQLKVQRVFDAYADIIQPRMEKVTGKPLYRQTFTVALTTFPRAPYSVEHGFILSPLQQDNRCHINIFLHELLHFQTIWYFRKENLKRINKDDFEEVKEALTVVLNNTFKDILSQLDFGYHVHAFLRSDILSFWKKTRNFRQTVRHGVSVFPKYKDTLKYLQFTKYTFGKPKQILSKIGKVDQFSISQKEIVRILTVISKYMHKKGIRALYPASMKKSRYSTAQDILKKHQMSCGSLATVVASVFRYLNIPVKLIDGYYLEDSSWQHHAWNEIYYPKTGKFVPFDITKTGFKVGKIHRRKAEYADWSEMKIK